MNDQPANHSHRDLFLSLVVPMYNEAEACGPFFARALPVVKTLTEHFEIICVNDGSTDDTLETLRKFNSEEPRIKIVNLTRNFGKEIALTAGIEHTCGSAVIPLDADLQDPPELIPEMVGKWREGFDCVIAIRSDRKTDSYLKRMDSTDGQEI